MTGHDRNGAGRTGTGDGGHPAADMGAPARRESEPGHDLPGSLGVLGAALWALYPVAIALLVIGFLVAEASV